MREVGEVPPQVVGVQVATTGAWREGACTTLPSSWSSVPGLSLEQRGLKQQMKGGPSHCPSREGAKVPAKRL